MTLQRKIGDKRENRGRREQERLEKFDGIIERLRLENGEGKIPIVVEGSKDVNALREFGILGRIYVLSKKPLHELAHEIGLENHREVLLLTDNDLYGKKATRKLKDFFLNEGVRPRLEFRYEFMKMGVKCIEELPSKREEIKRRREEKKSFL